MYKLRVYHKGGTKSRYDFPRGSKWADHAEMYKRDIDDGVYLALEVWRRSDAVATGFKGEIVWDLIEMYPPSESGIWLTLRPK